MNDNTVEFKPGDQAIWDGTGHKYNVLHNIVYVDKFEKSDNPVQKVVLSSSEINDEGCYLIDKGYYVHTSHLFPIPTGKLDTNVTITSEHKKAAKKSLNTRWYKIANAPDCEAMETIHDSTDCALCVKFHEIKQFPNDYGKRKCACPLRNGDPTTKRDCCDEYFEWQDYVSGNHYLHSLRYAWCIVDMLERIRDWKGDKE